MKIVCPHCFNSLDVPNEVVNKGGTLPCPKCSKYIPLHSMGGQDSASRPESNSKPIQPAEKPLVSPHEQMMFEPSEDILKDKSNVKLGDMDDLFSSPSSAKRPSVAPPEVNNSQAASQSARQQKGKPAFSAFSAPPPERHRTNPSQTPVEQAQPHNPTPPKPVQPIKQIPQMQSLDLDVNEQEFKKVPRRELTEEPVKKREVSGELDVKIKQKLRSQSSVSSPNVILFVILAVAVLGIVVAYLIWHSSQTSGLPPPPPSDTEAQAYDLELPERLDIPQYDQVDDKPQNRGVKKTARPRAAGRDKSSNDSPNVVEETAAGNKQSAPSLEGLSVRQILQKGQEFYSQQRYSDAAYAYQIVIQRDPKNATANRGMAVVLQRQGKTAESIKFFEQYLRLSPNAPDAQKIRELIDKYYE